MARRGIAIIFTFLAVAFVLSIGAFAALYLLLGREPSVPGNAMLTLRIGGDLAEVAPGDVFGYLRGVRTPTVRSIVDDLRKAKVDRRISAVYLRPTGFDTPYWGKLDELRAAVLDFKQSGKPVYAYLEYASIRDYYFASAADKIFLIPSGSLDLTGVATYELFLRGTLDKIGVYPDMHHIGQYKTAPNTFTEKTMTAAHREMDESLNRDQYDRIVTNVAQSRGKTVNEVRQLIDEAPFLPDQALKAGLIDDVAYEDQAVERLRASGGSERLRDLDGDQYARVSTASLGLDRGPKFAIIYLAGEIASGKGGYDPLNGTVIGSDTIVDYIRQARKDRSLRAIILRIDSPGGSAPASDAIWRELTLAHEGEFSSRPIVVSMSDLAASGGYYVAMPADVIVAQPSTLTGSIGIFGGKFVTTGAYEKLGARIESTSIGRNAEMESPARAYTAEELRKVQEQLDAFYADWLERAAKARHTTPQKINALGQGRVWTGRQAKENGLVDELGGLDRAIEIAKERANIPVDSGVELVVYPPKKSFYEILADGLTGGDQAAINQWMSANLSEGELETLRALRGPTAIFRRGEPLALMPFTFLR
jgi:protease-4